MRKWTATFGTPCCGSGRARRRRPKAVVSEGPLLAGSSRSEAPTRRLKPATRGRFVTGFSSAWRRTTCVKACPTPALWLVPIEAVPRARAGVRQPLTTPATQAPRRVGEARLLAWMLPWPPAPRVLKHRLAGGTCRDRPDGGVQRNLRRLHCAAVPSPAFQRRRESEDAMTGQTGSW